MRLSGQRVGILPAMFCLGVFSVLAQVVFMREMLVVFFGNELIIGATFAAWLLGISVGGFAARLVRGVVLRSARTALVLTLLLVIPAATFPLQVYVVRSVRLLLGVPVGGYASLGQVFASALVIFFPTCCSIGLFFPFACDFLATAGLQGGGDAESDEKGGRGRSAVSWVYTLEAVGSMLGGVLLTYFFLPAMSPYRIVFTASGIALLGAAGIAKRGLGRRVVFCSVLPVGIIILACGLLHFRWWEPFDRAAAGVRWRAFGILGEKEPGGGSGVVLADSTDTVYQNLALLESQGQYALYANGQLGFVFPDPIAYEHSIHFLMAQNPGVKRILLLGGCPVGDIPELLKYPLAELVYVELDPGVGRIIRNAVPREYDSVMNDPRVRYVIEDGPRFVQNCTDLFDAVIVNAPEPTTAAANRYYTLEFYRNIRRILKNTGFMFTAVTSSERLEFETIDLGASVYQTLAEVFPVVLVTAEETTRFFAADIAAVISVDRLTLYMRSDAADIRNSYFRPEYLQFADEIARDKVRLVKEKFESAEVPLNTNLRPVTFFYNLLLWNRFSGSRVEALLGLMKSMDNRILVFAMLCLGMILMLAGLLVRAFHIVGRLGKRLMDGLAVSVDGSVAGHGSCAGGVWARLMLGTVLVTTGFCGMALEVLLIFLFQGLYGYVYTRLGLIVAVFMFGLVLGAPSGRLMAGRSTALSASVMIFLEMLLVGVALGVPKLAGSAGIGPDWAEAAIYVTVWVIGWVVGAEFVIANRLFCDAGGSVGAAAAITDASDHLGAAAGSFVVGVLLVPVLGIQASCAVLATLKAVSLLCLLSGIAAMPLGVGTTSRPRV